MRVTESKALARVRELRNYSRMRKAEMVALFQNNSPPLRSGGPRAPAPTPCTRPPPPPPQMSLSGASPRGDTREPIDDRRPRKPTQ